MDSHFIKILFIGLHYQKSEEEMLLKICKNGVSAAHFTFEENVIDSIEKYADVKVLVSLPVGSFPMMSNKLFFKSSYHHKYQKIGFVNFPLLKEVIRRNKTKKAISHWINSLPETSPKYIVIYDTYLPFIKASLQIKRKHPECKIICIVPDLPGKYSVEYNTYNFFVNKYLSIKANNFYKLTPKIDGFIVLTTYMIKILNAMDKPHMIMECIVKSETNTEVSLISKVNKCTKIVMYAGELSCNVNLDVLMEAFSMIASENINLWICGTGTLESYIINKSNIDKRIKFWGFIPKSNLQKIQDLVDIYINPRQNRNEYTRYSFPSKNAESLKTGKPLIAYKLDGIPNDYDEFIFYPEDNSAQKLKEKIEEVCALDQTRLEDIKKKQLFFMNTQKSDIVQGKRIINFLMGL
ncbi:glycosyltransferase [Cloacibacillus porcorum]|uniref:glycosyltransferase n=1 Tax=Cloacibacillus porcorum TaxID=1197717 RepID=UPI003CFFC687